LHISLGSNLICYFVLHLARASLPLPRQRTRRRDRRTDRTRWSCARRDQQASH